MRILLLVWLCFITLLANSQTPIQKPTWIDTLGRQQIILMKRLDSLNATTQRISKTNDSINKELYYYRAKDDFYVMAVDRQGSHFEWLLGTTLAILAFFSYSYFKNEIGKLRLEFSNRISNFEEGADRIKYKMHKQSAHSLGTTSALIQGFSGLLRAFGGEESSQLIWYVIPHEIRRITEEISAYLLASETEKDLAEQDIKGAIRDIGRLFDKLDIEDEFANKIDEVKQNFDQRDKAAIDELNKMAVQIEKITLRNEMIDILYKINKIRTIL